MLYGPPLKEEESRNSDAVVIERYSIVLALAGNGLSEVVSTSLHFSEE